MGGGTCRNLAVGVAMAAFVSACASPDIDRAAANFDAASYSGDLAECRGSSAAMFMLSGFAGALAGSAIGALEGAQAGLVAGDSAEGAVIGSAVGGVIGLGVGTYDYLSKRDDELARCLRDKGYVVNAASGVDPIPWTDPGPS